MAAGFGRVVSLLRGLAGPTEGSDRELLVRFVNDGDQTAFETIVRRHGGMVLGVCRRFLRDQALCDDVFQATFIVLFRKASALRWHESVSGWLYEVAHRLAKKANGRDERRRVQESQAPIMNEATSEQVTPDRHVLLHEELCRLPEKYRSPLVLCYLEGKTGDQAAEELGIRADALKMRLHRGREFLRERLVRRGAALTSAVLAELLSAQTATATVPLALVTTTGQAVTQLAAGMHLASISPLVPALVEGVLQDMYAQRIRRLAVCCSVCLVLVTGVGFLTQSLAAPKAAAAFELKPVSKTEMKDVVAGNTAFATDLYAQLAKKEGNLFLSPYSISTALAMTYAGARGNTEKEMAKTLHFGLPQEKLHTAFGELVKATDAKDRGYKLAVANRLWGKHCYEFVPEFLQLTRDQYGAELERVEFANPEKASRVINRWVESKTEDKIKDLLKPDSLDMNTKLVLTNAIYFKGDWAVQFDKKNTEDQDFYLSKTSKKQVPLMCLTEREFLYRSEKEVHVLELAYKSNDLSMVVFLPKTIDGLADFEKSLSAERVKSLYPTKKTEVGVWLPRFKVTAEFELGDTLQAMGMKDAFVDGAANFSGISTQSELFIAKVIHKAFVDVNEQGTEAAAATAVVMRDNCIREDKPEFRADHPFFFVIKQNSTNSILFLGRVADPSAN